MSLIIVYQYINATDTELMKLGMMGVSVFVSAGDDGTPGKLDGAF